VVLLTVVAGSLAFGAVTAYNQIQHDNACSNYHYALLAATSPPYVPASSDYGILSSADRAQIRADVGAYNKALKTSDDPSALTSAFHEYEAAYVPAAMATQGC
jgi:hypothetical protein